MGRLVLIDDLRVRVVGKSSVLSDMTKLTSESVSVGDDDTLAPRKIAQVYFEETGGFTSTPLYTMDDIIGCGKLGLTIPGPALVMQHSATVVIEPGCTAFITKDGDICIEIDNLSEKNSIGTRLDPIYLSVFSHRFMGIAEQVLFIFDLYLMFVL